LRIGEGRKIVAKRIDALGNRAFLIFLQERSLTLSDETLAKLDEIWSGPGGEAPVAYAWQGARLLARSRLT
jgi:hypothetical protein